MDRPSTNRLPMESQGWQPPSVAGYSFGVTFLILKAINTFGSICVPDAVQLKGLDETEFGETASNLT
jgi:hypothetical protein